ncbi:hypothetical protein [Kitasatospora indigofera]|uniref:hypothetical protein n=1 Tax=Kitasatospora indigofera TaxID=67307 RepID=UPI0033BD478F
MAVTFSSLSGRPVGVVVLLAEPGELGPYAGLQSVLAGGGVSGATGSLCVPSAGGLGDGCEYAVIRGH